MFNFNHLYYFFVTAKYGGVTKAAKFLRIAQPSLSAQLHTLEDSIDFKLFRREGRMMALTEEGLCVYGYCQKMFDAAEELKSYIAKGRNYNRVGVTIAIANEVARRMSADLLSRLFVSNKSLTSKIRIISGHHAEVLEWLQRGEADAIITNHDPEETGAKTVREILSPVYLYAGLDFATMTSGVSHFEAQDILKKIDVGLVLPGRGSSMRDDVDQFILKHNLQNPIAFESDILQTCIHAVSEGLGVGFFPSLYVQHEILNQKLFRIGPERTLWHYCIYLAVANGAEEESWLTHIKLRFEDMEGKTPQYVEQMNSYQYVKK